MKAFKFQAEGHEYGIGAKTQQEAESFFFEEIGIRNIASVKEIPETEWHEKTITMYEDNNTDLEPFFLSISEAMVGEEPQLIYTNDPAITD